MRVSVEELELLKAAFADKYNFKAQELANLVGSTSIQHILQQIASVPPEMQKDLEKHVRETIDEQRRRVRKPR